MAPNQSPWPREWLMTDERLGARLWDAVEALPPGAGVIFRHYDSPERAREALARRIADACNDRGLLLGVARDAQLGRSVGAALIHNPVDDAGILPVSRSAHSFDEADRAISAGASLIFLSPIFPTRSHPHAKALAREEAGRIVAACPVPVIALGGMNRSRFKEREPDGFYGWAGIDAWLGEIRT